MSNRRPFTWTQAQLVKLSRVLETLQELEQRIEAGEFDKLNRFRTDLKELATRYI